MRAILFTFLVVALSHAAASQQIPCSTFDEHSGTDSPDDRMKGCRSFNELEAAHGIQIKQFPGIKSYACFATTFPEETSDLFIFVELAGVVSIKDDKVHNGFVSMKTFSGGVGLNEGFTNVTWTQYPKEKPLLWSAGTWLGHGDAEIAKAGDIGKPDPAYEPDDVWKAMHLPRLHFSTDTDTVKLRLELNNDKGLVETLEFNRWTGRARLDLTGEQRALRCVSVWEPK